MQNTGQREVKDESHPMNRFNDAEYKRWSENLEALKSTEADWGIESFLKQTEKE